MIDTQPNSSKQTQFHGGTFGALFPFLFFIVLVLTLAMMRALSTKAAGASAFCGFTLAFLLVKDKREFAALTLRGFTSNMLGTMLLVFLLAGVVAKLLDLGGLVKSLVFVATHVGLDGSYMPLIIFLTGAIISSATGTSGGTMATTTPTLLPLAVSLGCDPGVAMGAIVSGAMFGDNIAPVSDTTIASALTQKTSVLEVVRKRLKYAFIAGAFAVALFLYAGFKTTTVGAANVVDISDANLASLILLLVPVIIIVLMFKRKGLVFSMMCGILFGFAVACGLGLISPIMLVRANGVVAGGFDSMMTIFPFFYFIFVFNELLVASGAFDKMVRKISEFATTPRRAEAVSGIIGTLGMFFVSSPTVSIVTVGPLVREIMHKFNLARSRGANILDGFASGIGGTLPYASTAIFPLSIAIATGAVGNDFTVMDYLPYSFHCWGLIGVFWLSIITGFGREIETGEDHGDEQIV